MLLEDRTTSRGGADIELSPETETDKAECFELMLDIANNGEDAKYELGTTHEGHSFLRVRLNKGVENGCVLDAVFNHLTTNSRCLHLGHS